MPQSYNDRVLAELRGLLSTLLTGDIPKLADLRQIEALRKGIEQKDDPGFFPIRAAVSDLDAVPDEDRRQYFADGFLQEKDKERTAYLESATDDLKKAALALLHSDWISMS